MEYLFHRRLAHLPIFDQRVHHAVQSNLRRPGEICSSASIETVAVMISRASSSVTRVGARFVLRFAILFGFASLTGVDFVKSFVPLLWMATMLCAVVAALRKETPLDNSLNHWDEAAIFGALCCLASAINTSMLQ